MEKIKVSGCIVTYNCKDKISPTIDSIFENTKGVDFTLYVVDNGSGDGTADFISEKYPDVNVIRSQNDGFGAGHNKVIPFLDSDFHVVINPDILLKSDVITELAVYGSEHKDVGLLSPKICFEDGRLQMLGKRNPTVRYLGSHWLHKSDEPTKTITEYCMLDMPEDEPFEITNATGCFMFFRTSVFMELGGFDERFFLYQEDSDLSRRAMEVGRIVYHPEMCITHAWARENTKTFKGNMRQIVSMVKFFTKWGWKW